MSWRFVLTPKWLLRHVLVVALVVAMTAAGFWQLRRLDDKRTYKALVEARQEMPAAVVGDVLDPAVGVGDAAVRDVLYRTVTATGRYAAGDTVVVENRTLNGASGGWVLTPLLLDDGNAIVVNRGFVGFTRQGDIVPPSPPSGRVSVEGLLFPSQTRGRFGATDPDRGKLAVLARVDLARFEAQFDRPLYAAYVQLTSSDPPQGRARTGAPELVALGAPDPTEGPHLSYAVQWFTFTLIATGGYALLLRRVARDQALGSDRIAG